MSSYNYFNVHQSDGVQFDDLVALNADLNSAGLGELLDPAEFDYWSKPQSELNGFIKQGPGGEVLVTGRLDGEFNGYSSSASVYGCCYKNEFDIIARHITAGKLVVRFEQEGWPDEYYVLTPGKVEERKVSF